MANAHGPPIEDLHFAEEPDVDAVPGPASRRLIERQENLESNNVRYPADLPVALEAAKGATVRDADGNVFLDLFAGIGVVNVGHGNPYVLEAVEEQTETLAHALDFPNEVRLDLIDRLDDIAPGDLAGDSTVVFGGPTGSDAVEATIKLAKTATGNSGLIAFRGSYHGETHGALSLTSDRAEKEAFTPLLSEVEHLRYPYPFRQDLSPDRAVELALEEVQETLADGWSGLPNPAAIWVEAVQGEGGVVVPEPEFLQGLRDLADDHGVLLVVDEVQTGFGRTGKWFASEWSGVTPDAVPVAKAAGNGLPLSATIHREELDVWEPGGHTGTFRGYLPAMRASLRAIDYIESHDLLAHARDLGGDLLDALRDVESPYLGEVRGKGLYVGMEFVDGDGGPAPEVALAVRRRCMEDGVLVWGGGRGGHVVRLIPPLVLTRRQAEVATEVIAEAVREETLARA